MLTNFWGFISSEPYLYYIGGFVYVVLISHYLMGKTLIKRVGKKPLEEIVGQLTRRAFEALNASIGGGGYILDTRSDSEYKTFRNKRWANRTGRSYRLDVVVRVGIVDYSRTNLMKSVNYIVSFAAISPRSLPSALSFYPLDIRRRGSSDFPELRRAYIALARDGAYHFKVEGGRGVFVAAYPIV